MLTIGKNACSLYYISILHISCMDCAILQGKQLIYHLANKCVHFTTQVAFRPKFIHFLIFLSAIAELVTNAKPDISPSDFCISEGYFPQGLLVRTSPFI